MDERLYWLGFSVFSGIGPARFKKLLDYFGSGADAWKGNVGDLKSAGIGEVLARDFDEFRRSFSIGNYLRKLEDANVRFYTLRDLAYPQLLLQIKNPPIVLYVKGDFDFLQIESIRMIAVVGTRKITPYGSQVTEFLVRDLVEQGFVIVSGLAIGVDSRAHAVTVENKGKTIAVLGSGVDCCFPAVNLSLYRKILETGGAIVSEFPLGQVPIKGSFPSRNRIIAGLCAGVVVTEGSDGSGSLITAEDAFLNNRKVFAVPGPITSSYSRGPNSLIARGAIPVSNVQDILKVLSIQQKPRVRKIYGSSSEEQVIIELLQSGQLHVDELTRRTNIHVSKIGMILSLMEMKGWVRNLGTGVFALENMT